MGLTVRLQCIFAVAVVTVEGYVIDNGRPVLDLLRHRRVNASMISGGPLRVSR